ncbi:hypothetical protein [Komagataeibacter kakiaceti]
MSSYNDFLSLPKEEDQTSHRDEVNESAFRQALERLGKGKSAPRGAGGGKTAQPKQRAPRQADPTRRRKFVQDGDVRVEHQSLVTGRATPRAMHAQQEDRSETEHLRHKIQFELKLREQAELRLSEAQNQIRSLTTRIGHADVIAAEHKEKLASREAEMLALRAELFNAREESAQLREELNRQKAKPRAAETPRPAETAVETNDTAPGEPEPVKWWLR